VRALLLLRARVRVLNRRDLPELRQACDGTDEAVGGRVLGGGPRRRVRGGRAAGEEVATPRDACLANETPSSVDW
jgi:hypothetical protein